MRYDLALFLCCCKSFLGSSNDDDEENFYGILGIERDASMDEIKRAYKKKSLQMHPDKLAQRGQIITPEDQARFTRMKEAYECLSDPRKRETYDAIGEKGMKWIDEPMSMDPQELARNFTKASVLDRSKIFAIFVAITVVVLCLPVLVCLHLDGVFGPDASWVLTLIPLWLGNLLVLFYHSKVIAMPIQKPEDVPAEEWVDPFPLHKRISSLVRFLLVVAFEILVALKLDAVIDCQWALVFCPLLVLELTNVYQKWSQAVLKIITIQQLEEVLGKSIIDMTLDERKGIETKFRIVTSLSSPDFDQAYEARKSARQDLMKSAFRLLFVVILVVRFDTSLSFNWWLAFVPFWITIFLVCMANYQAFTAVRLEVAKKDPELFGFPKDGDEELGTSTNETTTATGGSNVDYGSVGTDGVATPEATLASALPELMPEEKEKLKQEVVNSGSKLCTQCCSQGFFLIILCLIVGKLQGASFSTLWLISPLLLVVSTILLWIPCRKPKDSEHQRPGILDLFLVTSNLAFCKTCRTMRLK